MVYAHLLQGIGETTSNWYARTITKVSATGLDTGQDDYDKGMLPWEFSQ